MLQRISKSTVFACLAMLVFSAILFSFSNKMGSDSFEVYINKKLAIQQYVSMKEPVKMLQLEQSSATGELEVYYNHCGKTGTARIIRIKDAQNKVLKEWRFQDTPGAKTSMTCNVKDITSLQKLNSGNTLQLYYSANELPEGRLLATIAVANTARSAK